MRSHSPEGKGEISRTPAWCTPGGSHTALPGQPAHFSSRPLAPVRVNDPSSLAPAPGRPPRPRTVRAGGGPDPWQPRDVNHNPGAAAGSPASPASCLSPALAAPPLAFGFAPRKAPRANERCLGTARSHRGPLRCHRPARGPHRCLGVSQAEPSPFPSCLRVSPHHSRTPEPPRRCWQQVAGVAGRDCTALMGPPRPAGQLVTGGGN